ncbi:MAG: hypothetical protein ABL899_02275 [Nitrospira sp.]
MAGSSPVGSTTVDFLVSLTPTAYGGGRHAPHKSDFRSDSYDAVKKLIDPKTIIKFLKKVYGSKLDSSKFDFSESIPVENRIANQFSFLHKKEENNSPAN